MYTPSAFAAPSEQASFDLIRQQVLGTVVWHDGESLQATPLPWLLVDSSQLQAHLPRANPLVAAVADRPLPVLVSFQGPSAYISPNWYPSKAETERMVPTWNYATVLVHGELQLHDDPAWVHTQMEGLTRQQEQTQPRPWAVSDAAPGFVPQLLRVLVGLSLRVRRVEAKFKLGQNREPRDRDGLRAGLRAAADPASLALLALTEKLG